MNQCVEVVRSFYDAVASKDGSALAGIVQEHFADDATIHWPESLPFGGTVAGKPALGKVFGMLATSRAQMGPTDLRVLSVVGDGPQVAVHLGFDWTVGDASIPHAALEIWSFRDGLAAEIRAFYWDTAACLSLRTHSDAPA